MRATHPPFLQRRRDLPHRPQASKSNRLLSPQLMALALFPLRNSPQVGTATPLFLGSGPAPGQLPREATDVNAIAFARAPAAVVLIALLAANGAACWGQDSPFSDPLWWERADIAPAIPRFEARPPDLFTAGGA